MDVLLTVDTAHAVLVLTLLEELQVLPYALRHLLEGLTLLALQLTVEHLHLLYAVRPLLLQPPQTLTQLLSQHLIALHLI